MCGIIGMFDSGGGSARGLLLGLERMEYRGYDSAGLALSRPSGLLLFRALGKVASLARKMSKARWPSAQAGIGHTRWATHGKPSVRNAHPHLDCSGRVAIVHNGIIENDQELRKRLIAGGHVFRSDTDSEVLSHLLEDALESAGDPLAALSKALAPVRGSVACLALVSRPGGTVILAARKGGGILLVGRGPGGFMAASDPLALAGLAREAAPLPEGVCVRLYPNHLEARRLSGAGQSMKLQPVPLPASPPSKGRFQHFMLKEIHEQARIAEALVEEGPSMVGRILPRVGSHPRQILLLGCGTSWHAALLGRIFFEELAGISARVEYASEFRSQSLPPPAGTLAIALSQSGETADTLGAARMCWERGIRLLSLVNVPTSALARMSDAILPLGAGPEVGVASTKAFSSQVLLLLMTAMAMAGPGRRMPRLRRGLGLFPRMVREVLALDGACRDQARHISRQRQALYLGRSYDYPVCLEGALKLKEISYIHAEGLPAGEVKHGPIALVEKGMPVIVVASQGTVVEKAMGNVQEILARGGEVIGVGNAPRQAWPPGVKRFLPVPRTHPFLASLLSALPLQLLAYHAAVALGRDVDQPRNLAKSVTVE